MKHEADWAIFPIVGDETPAWITTDCAWGQDGIDTTKPCLLHVRFPYPQVRDDGLPMSESFDLIGQVEDAIIPLCVEQLRAVHVASISSAGLRHLFFYAANDKGLADLLRPIAGVFPACPPSAMSKIEKDWATYKAALLPGPWQREWILNSGVCTALQEHGDDAEKPRPIEHFAYFKSEPDRSAFSAWLKDESYVVTSTDHDEDTPPDEADAFVVRFTHDGLPDPFDLSDRTVTLREKASDLGGEYDGWEARIVK